MLAIGFGLTLAIAACGSDSTPVDPTSPDTPIGSYSIMTVNGKTLPAALIDVQTPAPYKVEVMSGALNLAADGKYTVVTRTRETISDNTSLYTDSTFGTWTRSGTQISLKNGEDHNAVSIGTWAGLQLTFVLVDTSVATTFVYKK